MKTTVHLTRHGEVHNPEKILYGRIPGFVLSETGKQQVHALGKHIAKKKIRHVYTSPLDRTRETASILSTYIPMEHMHPDARLLENATPLEGKPLKEIALHDFNFYATEHIKNGGERIADIADRMTQFFEEIRVRHTNEEVLVVSHGDPIMITYAYYSGLPLTLASIRGDSYVPTATGFTIVFEGEIVGITPLKP